MRTPPGFARLLPLLALTGLAAGTITLLASARPVLAPQRRVLRLTHIRPVPCVGGCPGVSAPVPSLNIVDARGKAWDLADLPGHVLYRLDLRYAQWAGVDLHGATFTACDFRGCDLSSADLRSATFECCDLRGADLYAADLTGAVSYLSRWPHGLGTPRERWKHGIQEGVGP